MIQTGSGGPGDRSALLTRNNSARHMIGVLQQESRAVVKLLEMRHRGRRESLRDVAKIMNTAVPNSNKSQPSNRALVMAKPF